MNPHCLLLIPCGASRLVSSFGHCQTVGLGSDREGSQMTKHKQKKHEAARTMADSGKIGRKEFEKELAKLQVELTRLQTWVQAHGARVIVVFEGRDTAGKGV